MTPEESIAINRWLRHLKRYLKVARQGTVPEGVHQVRVATRRLDAWLTLGGWRVYRDDLRWLRRKAAAVRDIDVLLGRKELPRMLRPQFMAMKRELHSEFILACDDARLAAVLVGLAVVYPIRLSAARKRLKRMHADVIDHGTGAEKNGGDVESLHRLRRSLRRFRYGLELVGDTAVPLKKMQEILGNINDLAVAMRSVDLLPPDKVSLRYRETLENELALSLPLARGLWIKEKETIRRMVD